MPVYIALSPLPGTLVADRRPTSARAFHCFHSNTASCMEIASALHAALLASGIRTAAASDLPAQVKHIARG